MLLTGIEPAAPGLFGAGALAEGRAVAAGVALVVLVQRLGVVVDAVPDRAPNGRDESLRREVLGEAFTQPSGFLSLWVLGLMAEAAAVVHDARMRLRVARAAVFHALLSGLTPPPVLGRMDPWSGGWRAYGTLVGCLFTAGGSLLARHQSARLFYEFTKQCRAAMAALRETEQIHNARGET